MKTPLVARLSDVHPLVILSASVVAGALSLATATIYLALPRYANVAGFTTMTTLEVGTPTPYAPHWFQDLWMGVLVGLCILAVGLGIFFVARGAGIVASIIFASAVPIGTELYMAAALSFPRIVEYPSYMPYGVGMIISASIISGSNTASCTRR